jgi:hypothetical protein
VKKVHNNETQTHARKEPGSSISKQTVDHERQFRSCASEAPFAAKFVPPASPRRPSTRRATSFRLNSRTFVTSKNRNCQFDSNSECTHSVTHLMRRASTMHMRPIRNNSQGLVTGAYPERRSQRTTHAQKFHLHGSRFFGTATGALTRSGPTTRGRGHCYHSHPSERIPLSRRSYHRPMWRLVSRRPMPRAVCTHLSP